MQAEQVLNLQRERFWQAPNASQARADVQAWLTERVRLAGVPDAEVSVLLPRGFEKQGTIARIEAQVRGQLQPASFSRLLQDIEAEQRQVSVEFLELNNMLSPMLNLQLSFLFVAALLKRMRIGQHPFAGRVRRRAVPFDGASCRQAAGKPNPLGTPAIRLSGPPLSHSRSEERPVWSAL